MKIVMLGTGYVGLVTGTCFSEFGYEVICVDKDNEKINNLEKEENPYEEIINAEFSIIQENKKNEVNPRSHG